MSKHKKLAVLVVLVLLVSLGAFAQQPINLGQVVGTAPAAAGANVSTDSVPLTVAGSDYGGTPVKRIFKVDSSGNIYSQSTLAAETTKVIGTVRVVGNIGAVVDGPTGSAVPANAILMGGTDGTNTVAPYIDPCQRGAKTKTLINLAATTATKLVALASAKVIYVCSLNIVVAGANNVALISGTKVTTECDTSTVGVAGGTTAATGWNFAANGGLTLGNGSSWVLSGGSALDLCIIASANTQVSGSITTVTF